MRVLGRRLGLTTLDEAEAYARCHGSRGSDVRIVKLPPRRPRYDVLTTGEELRELFEQRLDARDPDTSSEVHAKAGSEEPASAPPTQPV